MRMTVNWFSQFKMIWANFSIFVSFKLSSLVQVAKCLGSSRNVPLKKLVWSFTIYFPGKRWSLLHPNMAQRSYFPLQSYSRKTLRKIAPKSARKYWESISDRAHAHEHGLLFCFVLFLLTFWYHSMHLEPEFQFSHGSSSPFMGVEPQCTVSLNSYFSPLSCTGM